MSNGRSSASLVAGGIVLAGGRSRRMGRSKAALALDGTTMLARVVESVADGLRQVCGDAAPAVVVVGAPGRRLPDIGRDIRVVRDTVADRGPLQGMEAGLAELRDRATAAFVASGS